MARPPPGQLANSTSNLGLQKPIAVEATWPKASIVIGNPPFLGGNKKRGELGDTYFEALDTVFKGRVPGGADLVCYWFDKARAAIETKGLGAAGLVATQSIRSGSNRAVLDAIRIKTRIFDAWSDEAWVNEGAAVRVSLVSFGWGDCCYLNGQRVEQINAELGDSTACDMSLAKPLPENAGIAFQGPVKVGAFDIEGALARKWLMQPNVNRQSNAVVLKPWVNGQDIAKRHSDTWIVDFGAAMDEHKAAEFELPFSYLQSQVKPQRLAQSDESRKRRWWLHGRSGEDYRAATSDVLRYIATPRVAKHRYFVWLAAQVWPDSRLYAIAKSDDITFGILSSRMHEAWSLANASMHGVGNDPTYNAKSCFETFPFPDLTPDQANQAMVGLVSGATSKRPKAVERPVPTPPAPGLNRAGDLKTVAAKIATAAKHLNDRRENWLNPPEWTDRIPEVTPLGMTSSPYPDRTLAKPGHEKDLADRTLTKLYNQRPAWLDSAHKALDATVAAAYGWADYTAAMPDEEILKRLLALNLERAAYSG